MPPLMKVLKPSSESEKHTRTTVDTMELTPKLVASWRTPPFQRELKINSKVLAVSQQIKADNGVLPGIITLGLFDGQIYVVDGQHRLSAFLSADIPYGYSDVRTVFFGSMAEMAEEYERLNSSLVMMRPDDKLRALEFSSETLQRLRKKCPFIGYDNIRRNSDKAPIVSMSAFVRAWTGSRGETPSNSTWSAKDSAEAMTPDETTMAIDFASMCFEAWQRDREYFRLWGALNLTICAWLYRRLVLGVGQSSTSRWTKFTPDQFRRGLMALSAEAAYVDWLVGRQNGERDRSPAYHRIKQIFTRRRLLDSHGVKVLFPQGAWTKSS